jgi:hypothetical protein
LFDEFVCIIHHSSPEKFAEWWARTLPDGHWAEIISCVNIKRTEIIYVPSMLVTKASTERMFFFMNILWMSEKLIHILQFESPELTLNTLVCICWECYVVKKHLKEDKIPPKNISDVKSKLRYDRRSVSQYVLVSSPIWDFWPEFAFLLKFLLNSYRFVIL